jgi:hypothetical protein
MRIHEECHVPGLLFGEAAGLAQRHVCIDEARRVVDLVHARQLPASTSCRGNVCFVRLLKVEVP